MEDQKSITGKNKAGSWETVDIRQGSYSAEQLNKIYRTLAKRTNQRIVRLRDAGVKTGNISVYGYLASIGRRRFNERPRLREDDRAGKEQMLRDITAMQGFLQSKRSTKTGRKAILKAIASTMGDRYGLNLNLSNMDKFLNDFEDTKAAASFSSETIIHILSSVTNEATKKETLNKIVKEIKDANSVKDAADKVSKIPGVTKNAAQILNDVITAQALFGE